MPRPLADPTTLKHPRQPPRKSVVTPRERVAEAPPEEIIALWEPLVKVLYNLILTGQPRGDNIGPRLWITLKHPLGWLKPFGFPRGYHVKAEKNFCYVKYKVDPLLLWLYEQRCAEYSPTELYKHRQGFLTGYTQQLNSVLDIEKELFNNILTDENLGET